MSGVKIINFHEINSNKDAIWFDQVVHYLKSSQKIVSCNDLDKHLAGQIRLKDAYLLTVDDGHKSFYRKIYPIIKKHNVPIAMFVSPKICLEQRNFWWQEFSNFDSNLIRKIFSEILCIPIVELNKIRLLSIVKSLRIEQINEAISRCKKHTKTKSISFQNVSFDELKEMNESSLVTIGAHTLNHPILLNENDSICKYEIYSSIDELGNILNQEIKYFAYPNGIPNFDYSTREMEYVRSKGVNISFSTVFQRVLRDNNRMEIPRGEISNGQLNMKYKLFLWEYWNAFIVHKNKNNELNDRKKMIKLLEYYTKS